MLFWHRDYLNDVCFEMISITILIVFVIPSIPQGKASLYQFIFLLILRLFQTAMVKNHNHVSSDFNFMPF